MFYQALVALLLLTNSSFAENTRFRILLRVHPPLEISEKSFTRNCVRHLSSMVIQVLDADHSQPNPRGDNILEVGDFHSIANLFAVSGISTDLAVRMGQKIDEVISKSGSIDQVPAQNVLSYTTEVVRGYIDFQDQKLLACVFPAGCKLHGPSVHLLFGPHPDDKGTDLVSSWEHQVTPSFFLIAPGHFTEAELSQDQWIMQFFDGLTDFTTYFLLSNWREALFLNNKAATDHLFSKFRTSDPFSMEFNPAAVRVFALKRHAMTRYLIYKILHQGNLGDIATARERIHKDAIKSMHALGAPGVANIIFDEKLESEESFFASVAAEQDEMEKVTKSAQGNRRGLLQ